MNFLPKVCIFVMLRGKIAFEMLTHKFIPPLRWFDSVTVRSNRSCRAPLQKGCPKHQGHKGDPGVTPGTCGASCEKAQVILVWVRAPGVGNASHPRILGVMRVRP
jgi:hypothetical protein